MKRKFIYLSTKRYDGTVFTTQVADWLSLYKTNGIDFSYLHLFYFDYLWNKSKRKKESDLMKNETYFYKDYSFCFPSRGLFVYINALLWHIKLMKLYKDCDELLLFSRMLCGKEIHVLKKLAPVPLIFYYDARAASAEENRYAAIRKNDFSYKRFKIFAHAYYTEFKTVSIANRIFSVSNALKKYFITNYNINPEKVFIYPCLSDALKFYFDQRLRLITRKEMGFSENNSVFLYSGGVEGQYHVVNSIFEFFKYVSDNDPLARFLLLSKDSLAIEDKLKQFPTLTNKLQYKSVANSDVINYLNAADFGLLFRDNVLMNNVASPSKFAEYMLCGLPCIISEGVGDYSEFCKNSGVGIVVRESDMKNWNEFDFKKISDTIFDRKLIEDTGKKYFSKQSLIQEIINEFYRKF